MSGARRAKVFEYEQGLARDKLYRNQNRISSLYPQGINKRRKIEAQFSGGAITSDGGELLLRSIDQRLKLTEQVAALISDPRDPDRIQHQVVDLPCALRVYGNGFMGWRVVTKT